MPFRRVMSCFFLLACCNVSWSEKIAAKHTQLELLAQQTAASPGQQVWLGVHFVLEKGWHIYWVNPGDSGQPPVLQWQLPPGFSAGEIQWPRPEKMQTAHLADYGYHDDVLLLVPVQASKSLSANSRAEIGLDAKWLVCREVCLPDHAQLHLALSVSSSPKDDPSVAPLFTNAHKLVPQPLPRHWKARAESRKGSFVLIVDAGRPLRQAEFFPLHADQVENVAPQKLSVLARGAQIALQKSDQLLKPVPHLQGVLVLPGETAYTIDVPAAER
ncbi:MAG TPA: protein-disulfide reductase DsbD domain-containing protein [Verrucomicrobiae bacterium]|nr:protein-disulfide reductase DsbD domain-containing protein [Verrucomicrobiae bacterium]